LLLNFYNILTQVAAFFHSFEHFFELQACLATDGGDAAVPRHWWRRRSCASPLLVVTQQCLATGSGPLATHSKSSSKSIYKHNKIAHCQQTRITLQNGGTAEIRFIPVNHTIRVLIHRRVLLI
jgi:hypothetical protein